MSNKTEEVDRFINKLEHPLKEEIRKVREMILGSNKLITEQIKWKAPSFGFNGDDRVTFNLYSKDHFKLIFHRGAKVKDGKNFSFKDDYGLLEWLAEDRAAVKLFDMKDVNAKKDALLKTINSWIEKTEDG